MTCNGNSSEFCGGPNRLNVYDRSSAATVTLSSTATSTSATAEPTVINGWTSVGCYTDAVGARTLAVAQFLAGAMTVDACTSACAAGGYSLAGVEYGGECFCDSQLRNGGGPAPDGDAQCNMPCNGNAAQMCGGPGRLNLYSAGPAPSGTVSSSTTTSATPTPTVTDLPAGWSYAGCYVDNAAGRIMINQRPDSASLTVESCAATCFGLGYSVAGMQYASQCFCDDFIRNGAALAAADSECGMACSGNAAEKCGGPSRMSIYANGTLAVYQPPTTQITDLPGNWQYEGCLK